MPVLAVLASAASLIAACDTVASHPSDPARVAPGVAREAIDLPAAEATCRTALAAAPENARTAYHLGRVIFYQGRAAEALPYLRRASDAGYAQAAFVLGFVQTLGQPGIPKDVCAAQDLWRKSVALDHPWSGYYLVEAQMAGTFAPCPRQVTEADADRFLALAAARIGVAESAGRIETLVARRKR
jgi:TPR repeat protein